MSSVAESDRDVVHEDAALDLRRPAKSRPPDAALAVTATLDYTGRMQAQRSLVLRLLRLAWPVALARLGIMGMGLTDVIVVGQLAPHELPHQALGWAPTAVLLVTGIGLLTGRVGWLAE